ncbi:YcjF family protein [Roseivivax sediminis]|uniref:Putative membrane protein n=1 Tax=Roseivivax sediminis TaxID=936889 RepID=A0A1I2A5B2_9RHOB|nr:TIGR01620 family protein [Roseivivax sediminis]SFE39111.1 putative membrane protein [Roseivivax sediminis]
MTERKGHRGPVLFELDKEAEPGESPAEAPPVPETTPPPEGAAMKAAARVAARQSSPLVRWFWRLLGAIVMLLVTSAAWAFVASLMAQNVVLGWAVTGLFGLFALVVLLIAVREARAFARLGRVDALHRDAGAAQNEGGLEAARRVVDRLDTLYTARDDTRWGRERLAERRGDVFDGPALLSLAERELLAPLDLAAAREVQAAARQVAGVTALVPLAFADVAAALSSNLRMIRRVAEIYGGRSGTLGTWRLTRAVFAHLLATGAIAAGEDMLEPILGGSILARLSRRFGEGVVNGTLTVRVGVAAMEVCRPIPFTRETRPSVRNLVAQSLTGLFDKSR